MTGKFKIGDLLIPVNDDNLYQYYISDIKITYDVKRVGFPGTLVFSEEHIEKQFKLDTSSIIRERLGIK